MRKLLFSLMLVAACAPLAIAQGASGDYDKFNFFAGYSHNRVDVGGDGDADIDDFIDEREAFHGFNASLTGNVSRYVGLKFDYSFHRRNGDVFIPGGSGFPGGTFDLRSDIHNFLGGVQIKDNKKDDDKRARPFGHVLLGGANVRFDVDEVACAQAIGVPCPNNLAADDTGFAAAVGGGLDVRLNNRLDIRAVQFDWNPIRYKPGNAGDARTSHNFRIGVGIVIH